MFKAAWEGTGRICWACVLFAYLSRFQLKWKHDAAFFWFWSELWGIWVTVLTDRMDEESSHAVHQPTVPGKAWKVTLSPGTAPLGGSRISTLPGELAHTIAAWDTTPLVSAGFRLQSRTAMRFCICMRDMRLVLRPTCSRLKETCYKPIHMRWTRTTDIYAVTLILI